MKTPVKLCPAVEHRRGTALRDVVRLGPADDATTLTAAQLRDVVTRLVQDQRWQAGDPEIWIVMDSGYDVAYFSHAEEELPVLHGTLLRLGAERLPGNRAPKPVWLWCSVTAATPADVARWWQSFLRRFDLEHAFRLMKQPGG